MEAEQVWAFRFARQRLLERAPAKRLAEVVRDVIGLQAQVASAASASLWARVEGATSAAIEDELFRHRRLARTWCMRGTAHLIHRDDHGLILRALEPESDAVVPWLERRGLSPADLIRLRRSVREALGSQALSRRELAAIVTRKVPEAASWFDSWGSMLSVLARLGVIVFGEPRSNETTFVRCDRWWIEKSAARPSVRVAGVELLRRYLHAFGPATKADFAYWSGLYAPRVARAFAAIGPELTEVEVNRRTLSLLTRDLHDLEASDALPPPRLLPHFDLSLLAHRDRAWLIEQRHRSTVYRTAGWVAPTILLEGRVAGTWSARSRGRKLEIELSPFRRLSAPVRARLRSEAESFAHFTGASDLVLR